MAGQQTFQASDYAFQLFSAELSGDRASFLTCLEDWRAENYQALQERVIALSPQSLSHHWKSFLLGISYFGADNFERAAPHFAACLAEPQIAALAHHFIGRILGGYLTATTNAEARDHLGIAAQNFPDWVENLVHLGRFCVFTGELDQATSCLRHALDLAPNNSDADYLYVSTLCANGNFDEVQTYLAKKRNVGLCFKEDFQSIQKENPAERKKISFARYPDQKQITNDFLTTIKKTVLADLDEVKPFITPSSRFFTIGSCFAGNLATALKKENHDCTNLFLGEAINTTFANREITEWITGKKESSMDAHMTALLGDVDRHHIIQKLQEADALIYTLGVAPCFFDAENGKFILPKASELNTRSLASQYVFRTTSVDENVENLNAIIDMFRRVNKKIKIFISVSPVPLRATFERKASVVADCLSKSILRVAAETVTAGRQNDAIYYWPSFEIVRWLSGHAGPFFGTDDGCSLHVSEKVVDQSIALFLEKFQLNITKPMT